MSDIPVYRACLGLAVKSFFVLCILVFYQESLLGQMEFNRASQINC